ncbi:CAP domain-containing protein [Aneurinibacillus tyrosinisolvens]|uniref:CAP domain-containing protein n=1 Tax=Aneurinibacillus tyrosinisolvens TaxID=1443435 RepID=UPI00063F2DF9|nr:CAP domain-containing protein [Aneurinibacillus tyrosinisolvens]
MKRVLAASLICASIFTLNTTGVQAASECPASAGYKTVYQTPSTSWGDFQSLLDKYSKQYSMIPVETVGNNAPAAPAKVTRPAQPAPQPVKQPAAPAAPAPAASATQGLTADEQKMVSLVNQERAKQGLAPLKVNMELQKLARLKAQDMINKNYFSHQSPTYGSPFDMMRTYGVTYRTAGENIAGNATVQAAHTSLMNSPGHRANILNSAFTEAGIGIVNGGPYGKMFVQMFKG